MSVRLAALGGAVFGLVLSAAASGEPAAGEPGRTIAVTVAADEELRARSGWAERIEARFATVSEVYDEAFGIRWAIKRIVAWNSDNRGMEMTLRLRELVRDVDLGDAEVLVGISGQPGFAKGAAATLGNVLLVLDTGEYDQERNAVILAHEFAHLFGAWHNSDRTTIMFGAGATTFAFDPGTRAIVSLMRDFDFRGGLGSLTDERIAAITEVFEAHRPPGEIHPVARAYIGIGYDSYARRDYEKAVDADRAAVRYSPDWGEARRMLSKALFRIGEHEEAWEQYVIARRLGVTPNWAYIREMRRALARIETGG